MNPEKTDTPSLATGTRYELVKELGRGGMGVVHLALSKGPQGFKKLVVLKMMRKQLLGDIHSHRMFVEEANISARLAHPNIVHVHEVCEFRGVPTMVMEYLEGQPLSRILRGDGPPAPRNILIYILTKVLAGLSAAHELSDYDGTPLNLVHRDASPHNVFVTFDGQVKVLDFGIAKAEGSEVETRAGELKGKLRYMPPEQILHLPQDRRIDIFAVGVTLWEVLVGKRFWGDIPDDQVSARLLAKDLPSLPAEADVPDDLRAICARAIAVDPEKRYPTAEQPQRDLEEHLLRQREPVGADDVALFMQYRFGGEQDLAKVVIESHVRSGGEAVGPTDPYEPTRMAAETWAPKRVASPSGESKPTVLLHPVSPTKRAPWRSRWISFLLVPGGIVLLALAVMVGVGVGERRNGSSSARAHAGIAGQADDGAAARCEAGFKSCDGTCLSLDRPDRGCGGPTCYACNVPNATARCNFSHHCDIAVCARGFDDCDGDLRNGCETNVRTDPDNCGACRRKCPLVPHAQRGCGDACTIWRCERGYRDCNGVVADGCEVPALDDAANCQGKRQ